MVLGKTLECPLDCKEIKPVNPKGIFIGRTHAKPEAPILRPPDTNSRLIGKRPYCWGRLRAGEERGNRG